MPAASVRRLIFGSFQIDGLTVAEIRDRDGLAYCYGLSNRHLSNTNEQFPGRHGRLDDFKGACNNPLETGKVVEFQLDHVLWALDHYASIGMDHWFADDFTQ